MHICGKLGHGSTKNYKMNRKIKYYLTKMHDICVESKFHGVAKPSRSLRVSRKKLLPNRF